MGVKGGGMLILKERGIGEADMGRGIGAGSSRVTFSRHWILIARSSS